MTPPVAIAFVTRLPTLKLSTSAEAVTSWIQVGVVGTYTHPAYGDFDLSAADLQQMEENFRVGRYPVPPTEICIDYDHLSMHPRQPGDSKAAAWFKELELRADGVELWARVEWTDAGKHSVGSKEYRFISPAFMKQYTTHTGEKIGCTLIGGAITNTPFLQGMAPATIAASGGARADLAVIRLAEFSHEETCRRVQEALARHLDCDEWSCYVQDVFDDRAIYRRHGTLYRIGYTVAENGSVTFDGLLQEVTVSYTELTSGGQTMPLITLKDAQGRDVQIDATALEQTELVRSLRTQVPAKEATVVAASQFQAMQASITSLNQQVTTLSGTVTAEQTARQAAEAKLAAQEQKTQERDADDAVVTLLRDGKLLPVQKDWARGLALSDRKAFDAFAASAPVVSPIAHKPFGSGGTGASGGTALSRLDEKAKALRAINPKLTREQAEAHVLAEEPALYAEIDAEHGLHAPATH